MLDRDPLHVPEDDDELDDRSAFVLVYVFIGIVAVVLLAAIVAVR